MNFTLIKSNYDKGLWNKLMVAKAVLKNVITANEYTLITGDIYIA
jgi:hypothetical protein